MNIIAANLWAFALTTVVLTLTAPGASFAEIAGYPPNVAAYDAREVALLPNYCKYTQSFRDKVRGGNNPEEIKRWTATMGDVFHAMHHYCWGLMKTNRALILARTKEDRLFYLNDSLGEFDYVIERSPTAFVLLPEIITRKGENLMHLGRAPQAIAELRRAIDLKADYWPPYAALADHYRTNGELAKAREILMDGLSLAPSAAALQRRLNELGGPGAGKRAERRNEAQGAPTPVN